jgi:phosphoadenosine phosphosulfate reductase
MSEAATPFTEVVLAWADRRFGAQAAVATSFGAEDVVLIDLAVRHAPRLGVFTLDTGRLPPETYEVMQAARDRYGLSIETYFPERAAVEKLEREKGYFSFRLSVAERKECCGLRKVEPLGGEDRPGSPACAASRRSPAPRSRPLSWTRPTAPSSS